MTRSEICFLLVLAIIPVQLSKFLFPDYSYVLGIPIDYRAPAFYLSDLFIVGYIFLFTCEAIGKKGKERKNLKKLLILRKNFIIAAILLNFYLVLTAIFTSVDTNPSLFFAFKTIEFSTFALFASITLTNKKIASFSFYPISLSLIWQSALLNFQFLLQKSVGLEILGERSFDTSTISIAHTQFLGDFWLRPYGTFPHPNVAGAFLVIYMTILGMLSFPKKFAWPKVVAFSFAIFATLLTFSKVAILTLFLILAASSKNLKVLVARLILLLLVLIVLIFAVQRQIASIAERLTLAQAAFDITLKSPLFGVGSSNFIPSLADANIISLNQIRLLQPVHNVFILVLCENGILGLLLFGYLLYSVVKNASAVWQINLFFIILIFATFDHFIWTLQQGRLLFWLATAYILSASRLK